MVGGTRIWRNVISSTPTGRAKVEWRPVTGGVWLFPRATMSPFFFIEVEERFYIVRGVPSDDYVPPEDTIKVERKWRPIEQGDLSTVFRYENTTER